MISLADSEVTLSGAMRRVAGTSHLPLASALELSLDVVRMVAREHEVGKVVGVLDAAHLICRRGGTLQFGGHGGNPVAPELAAGGAPDRLTDVYALGALMYRLLTGRRVEQSRIIEPPNHFNPAVDSDLDALVLSTLDEDPSERPYSARALEQTLLEIFDELGLEHGSRAEATKLIDGSLPLGTVARTREEEVDDEEDFAPPRSRVQQFLYDLGWVSPEPRRAAVQRRPVDEDGDLLPPQTKLGRFMYDLGWLQGIDWDAAETRLWLKRGGIALGVLLALFVFWPSGNKGPRPGSAQALAAQAMMRDAARPSNVTKAAAPAPAPQAKLVVKPAAPAAGKRKR